MILGLSITTYTLLHTVLSLLGIVAGLVVAGALATATRLDRRAAVCPDAGPRAGALRLAGGCRRKGLPSGCIVGLGGGRNDGYSSRHGDFRHLFGRAYAVGSTGRARRGVLQGCIRGGRGLPGGGSRRCGRGSAGRGRRGVLGG